MITQFFLCACDFKKLRESLEKVTLKGFVPAAKEAQEGETLPAEAKKTLSFARFQINGLVQNINDVGDDLGIRHDLLVDGVGLCGIISQRAQVDKVIKDP